MSQKEIEYGLQVASIRIETIHVTLKHLLRELDAARMDLTFFMNGLHPNGNGNGQH